MQIPLAQFYPQWKVIKTGAGVPALDILSIKEFWKEFITKINLSNLAYVAGSEKLKSCGDF